MMRPQLNNIVKLGGCYYLRVTQAIKLECCLIFGADITSAA